MEEVQQRADLAKAQRPVFCCLKKTKMETNRGRHLTRTFGLCTYILTCEAHRRGMGRRKRKSWGIGRGRGRRGGLRRGEEEELLELETLETGPTHNDKGSKPQQCLPN